MRKDMFVFNTQVWFACKCLKVLLDWDLKHNIYRGLERTNRVLRTIDEFKNVDVMYYSILIRKLLPVCTDYICDANYKLRNDFTTEFYKEMGEGAL